MWGLAGLYTVIGLIKSLEALLPREGKKDDRLRGLCGLLIRQGSAIMGQRRSKWGVLYQKVKYVTISKRDT
jgi:hypothetical protein